MYESIREDRGGQMEEGTSGVRVATAEHRVLKAELGGTRRPTVRTEFTAHDGEKMGGGGLLAAVSQSEV